MFAVAISACQLMGYWRAPPSTSRLAARRSATARRCRRRRSARRWSYRCCPTLCGRTCRSRRRRARTRACPWRTGSRTSPSACRAASRRTSCASSERRGASPVVDRVHVHWHVSHRLHVRSIVHSRGHVVPSPDRIRDLV